eukprot:2731197-Prymnesium_polylepis.1
MCIRDSLGTIEPAASADALVPVLLGDAQLRAVVVGGGAAALVASLTDRVVQGCLAALEVDKELLLHLLDLLVDRVLERGEALVQGADARARILTLVAPLRDGLEHTVGLLAVLAVGLGALDGLLEAHAARRLVLLLRRVVVRVGVGRVAADGAAPVVNQVVAEALAVEAVAAPEGDNVLVIGHALLADDAHVVVEVVGLGVVVGRVGVVRDDGGVAQVVAGHGGGLHRGVA